MNEALLNYIQGYKEKELILQGLKKERITSGRINPLKSSWDSFLKEIEIEGIKIERIPFFEYAFTTDSSLASIQNLDIYKNGGIYIQSLSSMLPVLILNPHENETILDMAAAPGGKTSLIAANTHNKAMITACEANPIRFQKLAYNLNKQGVKNAFLIQKDARLLDDLFHFDKILLDAPCSGSGTLNLNEENTYFTTYLVEKSIKTQKALLRKASTMLKKGDLLLYSTCSILKEENESVVKSVLDLFEVEPITPLLDNHLVYLESSIEGVLTVCPNDYYEGFFMAKLRKK